MACIDPMVSIKILSNCYQLLDILHRAFVEVDAPDELVVSSNDAKSQVAYMYDYLSSCVLKSVKDS